MTEMKINSESSSFDFVGGKWQTEINVRDFIQKNYTPYEGDDSFLAEATERTKKLWDEVLELYKKGVSKKKVSLIDSPTMLVSICGKTNQIIFQLLIYEIIKVITIITFLMQLIFLMKNY